MSNESIMSFNSWLDLHSVPLLHCKAVEMPCIGSFEFRIVYYWRRQYDRDLLNIVILVAQRMISKTIRLQWTQDKDRLKEIVQAKGRTSNCIWIKSIFPARHCALGLWSFPRLSTYFVGCSSITLEEYLHSYFRYQVKTMFHIDTEYTHFQVVKQVHCTWANWLP